MARACRTNWPPEAQKSWIPKVQAKYNENLFECIRKLSGQIRFAGQSPANLAAVKPWTGFPTPWLDCWFQKQTCTSERPSPIQGIPAGPDRNEMRYTTPKVEELWKYARILVGEYEQLPPTVTVNGNEISFQELRLLIMWVSDLIKWSDPPSCGKVPTRNKKRVPNRRKQIEKC